MGCQEFFEGCYDDVQWRQAAVVAAQLLDEVDDDAEFSH